MTQFIVETVDEAVVVYPGENTLQAAASALAAEGWADAAAASANLLSGTTTAVTRWVRQPATITATGYYNATTGAFVANASYRWLLQTLTGAEMGVRAVGRVFGVGSALAVYYSDAAGTTFLSSEYLGTGTSVTYNTSNYAILNPPTAARSVRICSFSVNAVGIEILTPFTISTVDTKASLGNAVANSVAVTVDSGITPTVGSYYDVNGNLTANGGYSYMEYTVTANDISYTASGLENISLTALANYIDANGQSLGQQFLGTGSNVTYTNQALTVPINTAKIRMSGVSSGGLTLAITRVPSSLATTIATNTANGTKGLAAANSLTTLQDSGATATDGSYVNAAGGLVASGSFRYLDYDVTGEETGMTVFGLMFASAGVSQLVQCLSSTGVSLRREVVSNGAGQDYRSSGYVMTWPLPAGTTKIRICGTSTAALTLSVNKVQAGIAALVNQLNSANVRPITMIGDSTAAQVGPVMATQKPTRTFYQQGIGGQLSQQVAARLGAVQVTLTAGITLPTSGSVACTPSIDLMFNSSYTTTYSMRVLVLGIACNLVCTASTGAYTLSPITTQATTFTIPAGTPIQVISGVATGANPSAAPSLSTMLAGTMVLRTSRNDTGTIQTGSGRTTILGYIQGIATQVASRGGRLLIATGLNGNRDMPTSSGLGGAAQPDAATADLRLSSIQTFNALILSTFPDVAVDPVANHVMRGGSTNRTPVSTTYAVLDEPTMDTDGLHESVAVGRPRTATFFNDCIDARDW